jgi:hypothetical protein
MEESEVNLLLINNLKDVILVSTDSLIKTFLSKLNHVKGRLSTPHKDIIDQIKIYAIHRINVSKVIY